MKILAIYFILINTVAAIVCITDKVEAKTGGLRVPEKILFILSLLGGATAMYGTMLSIRHKTRHKRFMIGLPLIIAVQYVLLMIFLYLVA